MKRQRGNGLVAVGRVVARETTIVETIRIDATQKSPGEMLADVFTTLDKLQRGWRMIAIEIEIEKGVAEYSSHGAFPMRKAKPGEFK